MQQNYQQLLTDVIKKQIIILGPDITLAKARNVKGLVVADDGTVTDVSGNPQQVTQALVDQFVQLSGEIVKKTMEPLLLGSLDGNTATVQMPQPIMPQPIMQQPQVPMQPTPQMPVANSQKSVQ